MRRSAPHIFPRVSFARSIHRLDHCHFAYGVLGTGCKRGTFPDASGEIYQLRLVRVQKSSRASLPSRVRIYGLASLPRRQQRVKQRLASRIWATQHQR